MRDGACQLEVMAMPKHCPDQSFDAMQVPACNESTGALRVQRGCLELPAAAGSHRGCRTVQVWSE